MKNWDNFKFTDGKLRNKERFFKRNKIEEKNLTEDEKFLIEIKWGLSIWHPKEEIINWLKVQQETGKIKVDSEKEEKEEEFRWGF